MANKAVATEATVFAAADELRAKGVEPTYEGIRDILGGGSNSTIKPYLHKWEQTSAGASRPVPEAVQARATVLAQAIWGIAFREALTEFERAKLLTDAEVESSKKALSESIKISVQHEERCDELQRQLEAIKSDCVEARVKLRQVDELKLELAEAKECIERFRQACESLNREVATLTGENNTLRAHGEQLLAQVAMGKTRTRVGGARARKSTS